MEYTTTKDNFIITMILDETKDVLTITMLDSEICEKYNCEVCGEYIIGKKVINKIKVLYEMLKSGFDNIKECVKLKFQKNCESDEYEISLKFDYFVKDEIGIILSKNNDDISLKQTCDFMDKKIKKTTDLLENKFTENLKLIKNEIVERDILKTNVNELKNNFDELKLKMKTILDKNKKVMEQCEEVKNIYDNVDVENKLVEKSKELNDYMLHQPIYFTLINDFMSEHGHRFYSSIPICLNQIGPMFMLRYECNGYGLYKNEKCCYLGGNYFTNFNMCRMKYIVDKIQTLRIHQLSCENLKMIPVSDSITSIILNNVSELKEIEHLINFTNLQKIEIRIVKLVCTLLITIKSVV